MEKCEKNEHIKKTKKGKKVKMQKKMTGSNECEVRGNCAAK